MFLPLVLLFIVVPIVEIYVIIQVGQAIGPWWTIALLIVDSIVGAWLMRHQGRAAWRRFNQALAAGKVPHKEVIDGVLVIFGGALLLTPGFTTDIFGALFLLPPTRAAIRAFLMRRFSVRLAVGAANGINMGVRGARSRRRPPRDTPARPYDVEGTATDAPDPPALP
jgi:UPF0716 protein FxsA